MSSIWIIARKEFRGFFSSPIAFFFLAVFLSITFLYFFRIENFFANNLADVRSLFSAMPWVLILLVSALTMRLWSDEQKSGTIEVLMTLPIPNHQLVLGKFLAGWMLVAMALTFTLSLPITVSYLGALDWGPVLGGYFASLLLGGAYLAMGLCVSSVTDNQIVSLIVTLVLGFFFYAIGREDIALWIGEIIAELLSVFSSGGAGVFSYEITNILQKIGTTSHFQSIERGLFDSRDFFYFLGLIVFFLALNAQIILGKRQLPRKSSTELNRSAFVILLALNIIAMNFWMSPRSFFRWDLTEKKIFTLSQVTQDLLQNLNEQVTLQVIVSEENHELIKPLIPQLVDLAQEYAQLGGDKIRYEKLDPIRDEQLAQTLRSRYNIEAVSVPKLKRFSQSIIGIYFQVLVKYGDRYEVLNLTDLVDFRFDPATNEAVIRFKNLEYDLTKTIKKVVYDFQSFESAFDRFDGQANLTFFITEEKFKNIPEGDRFLSLVENTSKAALEIEKIASGHFVFEKINPLALGKDVQSLYEEEGLLPFNFIQDHYFALRLDVNGQQEWLQLREEMDELSLKRLIENALKRYLPGFTKTIGLWVGAPAQPQQRGFQQPPQSNYAIVQQYLSQEYSVRLVQEDIVDGKVPDDVDILLVIGLGETLSQKAKFAFDQFVMSGRPVIVCQGLVDASYDQYAGRVAFKPRKFELEDILFHYGVQVVNTLVQSQQCQPFFEGDPRRIRLKQKDYSLLDIRDEGLDPNHSATAGLPSLLLPWSSPVRYNEDLPLKFHEIIKTSPQSWRQDPQGVEEGRPSGSFEGPQTVAVALQGPATSWFKDKQTDLEASVTADRARPMIDKINDIRLTVVGSHMLFNDEASFLFRTANQFLPGILNQFDARFVLLSNLINWGLEDEAFSQLRGREQLARTLRPLEDKDRWNIEITNYALITLLLVGVLVGHFLIRRSRKPLVTFAQGS